MTKTVGRYYWNAENRMVMAEELYAPTNREPYVITYNYDHRGRMVRKDVALASNPSFSILHSTFVWDGWNIIRETTTEPPATDLSTSQPFNISTDYIWGLDIDGSLQGAGGVGSLLAVLRSDCVATNSSLVTRSSSLYFPTYDANGNVSEYVTTNGEIVAHYDYSPFGETLIESGDLASSFTHRFSTKPWCPVTGLYEYQMRKYRPEIGRWLSRDPIEEESFFDEIAFDDDVTEANLSEAPLNTYLFSKNNFLVFADYNGLSAIAIGLPGAGACAVCDGPLPFGDVVAIGILAYCAISNLTDDHGCYPCQPSVGTFAYEVHFVPPSRPHWPFKGTHTHHFIMEQSPYPMCKCFWNRTKIPPTDGFSPFPNEIPLPGPAQGGGPF